jgi:hypothetical protein
MPQVKNTLSQQAAALLDLPSDACRWPIEDATWCGERATHGAYCDKHRQASRAGNQRGPAPGTIDKWLRQMNAKMAHGGQWAA